MHTLIERHRTGVLALAKRHGIRDVRVFGSMVRGDAGDASAVDLLVTLAPGASGLALGGLLMDVQELTRRRVDVLTDGVLHSALRDCALDEAREQDLPQLAEVVGRMSQAVAGDGAG